MGLGSRGFRFDRVEGHFFRAGTIIPRKDCRHKGEHTRIQTLPRAARGLRVD